jgi:hypothetical protein
VAVEVVFTLILIWLTYHKLVVLVVVALVDMVEVQLLMPRMQLQTLVRVVEHQDTQLRMVDLAVLVSL